MYVYVSKININGPKYGETLPWLVRSPAEKRGGLGKGLTTFSRKTDCYENIDQKNSTELGRGRASRGEYDAIMQAETQKRKQKKRERMRDGEDGQRQKTVVFLGR